MLEDVATQTGPFVNAIKIEYIFYNQNGDVKTVKRKALKKVEHFTYHFIIQIAKALTD